VRKIRKSKFHISFIKKNKRQKLYLKILSLEKSLGWGFDPQSCETRFETRQREWKTVFKKKKESKTHAWSILKGTPTNLEFVMHFQICSCSTLTGFNRCEHNFFFFLTLKYEHKLVSFFLSFLFPFPFSLVTKKHKLCATIVLVKKKLYATSSFHVVAYPIELKIDG
jgi:hypothetical protein